MLETRRGNEQHIKGSVLMTLQRGIGFDMNTQMLMKYMKLAPDVQKEQCRELLLSMRRGP